MPEKNINLQLLLEGCLRNNHSSQRKLYEHFYGYGMNICLRYAKNKEEALEILNDGFLHVFRKIDYYDFDYPFKSWLRRILINAAIDYHRLHHKHPPHLELTEATSLLNTEMTLPDLSPNQDLLPILQQLSPAYRMVFNLYVMEGYKHHEIAKLLEISVGTSKSNLLRAKEKLRVLVQSGGMKMSKNK